MSQGKFLDGKESKGFSQFCTLMSHSDKREAITALETWGEGHACEDLILLCDCMCSSTPYLQAMTPKSSVIPYKLHGQIWAKIVLEFGHSLDGLSEILHHDGCFPKAPNLNSTFSHAGMMREESKCPANHLPHLYL